MHVRISTLTQSGVICSSVLIKAQELQACFQCRQGDKNMIQIQSSALQRFTQHSAQISIYLQLSLYITDSVSGSSTHDFDHPAVHFGRSGSLCRLIQHKGFTSIKIQDKKESEGDKRGLTTPERWETIGLSCQLWVGKLERHPCVALWFLHRQLVESRAERSSFVPGDSAHGFHK